MSHPKISVVHLDEAPKTRDLEGLRQRLRAHLDGGVSQKAVARAIAKSATAVSLFLAGKYNGDNEAVAEALDSYLRRMAERELVPAKPTWQETTMARGLLDVLHTAAIRGRIVVVVGDPGLGKTMTIQAYAERHPETIVVTAHEGIRGAKALVSHLLSVSKVRAAGGRTLDSQLNAIVAGLRGSGRLIVVDDCQTLHPRSLESLRYIHDTAGVGLALVGNLTTHPLLTQQGAGQFAQLFSRVGCVHHMGFEDSRREPWTLADVALVVRSACPDLDDEQVAFLHAILGAPLCDMRTVRDVLFDAMDAAAKLKAKRVTMGHLRTAAANNDRAAQVRAHLPARRSR